MRISDWSSDVCSSDLLTEPRAFEAIAEAVGLDQAASDSSPAASDALVNAYEIFVASFEDVGSVYGVLDALNISALSAIQARPGQIGRASCRERVCPYVYISGCSVPIKKQLK